MGTTMDECGRQDSDHEDRRGDQDRAPPPDPVGDSAGADGADGRADQQQAGDQLFLQRCDVRKVVLEEQQAPDTTPVS